MENWKDEISKIESHFGHHEKRDWIQDIKYSQYLIQTYPNDVEVNVRVIYLLHNIILEENHTSEVAKLVSVILPEYFKISRNIFSENAEYLFFIGKILHIAEWYFGIYEVDKLATQTTAFIMQEKALELDSNNLLYKWAVMITIGTKEEVRNLSNIILNGENQSYIKWLQTKGFPGIYILDGLKYYLTSGASLAIA